jgi:hypothetical protein
MAVPRPAPKARVDLGNNVSRVLRILMAVDGVDQQTVAAEIGMDGPALSRTMKGQRRWQLDEIELLAEVFDVSPAKFLEPADQLVLIRGGGDDDDPGAASISQRRRRRSASTEWYCDDFGPVLLAA